MKKLFVKKTPNAASIRRPSTLTRIDSGAEELKKNPKKLKKNESKDENIVDD